MLIANKFQEASRVDHTYCTNDFFCIFYRHIEDVLFPQAKIGDAQCLEALLRYGKRMRQWAGIKVGPAQWPMWFTSGIQSDRSFLRWYPVVGRCCAAKMG